METDWQDTTLERWQRLHLAEDCRNLVYEIWVFTPQTIGRPLISYKERVT